MTREETIKILMVIQAAYPNYKPQDKSVVVNIWNEMLNDCSYEQVSVALKSYIQTDTKGFAPGIGDIRGKIQEIFSQKDDLNEISAWGLVWKAIGSSGEYERAERNFMKLPVIVRRAVRNPGQLLEWARTQNMNVEVVSSNFMRVFRIEQQRERERKKLSPDLLKLMKPSNNVQIEDKPRAVSVAEQRIIAEQNASPASEGFKNIVKKRFYEQN